MARITFRKHAWTWAVGVLAMYAGAAAAMTDDANARLQAAETKADDSVLPADAATWKAEWRARRDAALQEKPDLEYDPTSLLVKFTKDAKAEDKELLLKLVGGGIIQDWPGFLPGAAHISTDLAVEEAIRLIETVGGALGAVEYAEPDHLYRLGATPNDSSYPLLWGMNNTGQTVNGDPGIANADIDANLAWDLTTGSSTFVVGMADSGLRSTHVDLAGNRWTNPGEIAGNNIDDDGNGYIDDVWGWDFWNNDRDPTDDNGHGTHTAGTVGAVGNNGTGVSGVAWSVRLVGLKIGSRNGSVSSSAGISALNYCVGKGIKISNHSWGGTGFSSTFNAAVDSARAAGHMLVCAAGNSNINNEVTPFYPASYAQDNIISVLSIDNNNVRSSFSNYGATRVDLGAPGSTILSTYISRNSNTAYAYLSGTSMAAPHVTGVAVLVWSRYPSWTYLDVRNRLLSTTRANPNLTGRCVTGGVVNAWNAVQ